MNSPRCLPDGAQAPPALGTVDPVPHEPIVQPPHTVEALLRLVVQARDAEVALLKLMVDKLKLQLLRPARRVRQLQRALRRWHQAARHLLEGATTGCCAQAKRGPGVACANTLNPRIDRSLPAHLPRETQVHRPERHGRHHDAAASPAAAAPAAAGCARSARTSPSNWNTCPAHFKVIRHVRPKLACVRCQSDLPGRAPSRPIARGLPGPGAAGARDGGQVLRPPAAVPAERHLRARGRGARPLHDGRLGGPGRRAARPAGGGLGATRWPRQGARRRHAGEGARPGRGQDQDRPAVGLCARRPARRRHSAAGGVVPYSPDRKGEHPQAHLRGFRGILQADAYGGWGSCTPRASRRGGLLGACAPALVGPVQGTGQGPDSMAAQALQRIARSTRSRPTSAASRPTCGRPAPGARRDRCSRRCTPG
jgi:transposase